MSYDLTRIEERHRVVLEVAHVGESTTIRADLVLHLAPSVVESADRVSVMDLDVRWVHAASVPDLALELARVLERVAAGLREGPGGVLRMLAEPTPSPEVPHA